MNANLLNLNPRTALPTTIPLRVGGTSFSLGGPYGLNFSSGGGSAPPTPTGWNASGATSVAQVRSQLMAVASSALGYRISWKKLVWMLLHLGLAVVKQLTNLDDAAIAYLWTTRPHRGRRGPHLNTIAKRARQVQHYKHRISKIARILGSVGPHHHTAPALPPARRRRRR